FAPGFGAGQGGVKNSVEHRPLLPWRGGRAVGRQLEQTIHSRASAFAEDTVRERVQKPVGSGLELQPILPAEQAFEEFQFASPEAADDRVAQVNVRRVLTGDLSQGRFDGRLTDL